jgi:hypothetical protein
MLLELLSEEQQVELKSLKEKYPQEYKKLEKQLFKKGRYYPSHGFYGIEGYTYLANDTYILGQHWFYDNLLDHHAGISLNNLLEKI